MHNIIMRVVPGIGTGMISEGGRKCMPPVRKGRGVLRPRLRRRAMGMRRRMMTTMMMMISMTRKVG